MKQRKAVLIASLLADAVAAFMLVPVFIVNFMLR